MAKGCAGLAALLPLLPLLPSLADQVELGSWSSSSPSFVSSSTSSKFSREDFPPGFVFGAGTSAYQVEGAVDEDGRRPSIWDTYTHAGMVADGSTADVSSDEYHKYKEDVKLMSETGLEAYRFSISWSRLIPNGRGPINPKGRTYYKNLINALVKHGIQPHVTLYHFDLPQVLEDEYLGWLSPRIVDDFTAYADVCFREFGDKVSHWTTINEPNILGPASYDAGVFPPCRCSYPFGIFNCTTGNSTVEPYVAIHHVLLAHAAVVELYRSKYQAVQKGWVGINVYTAACYPFTNSTADVEATQRASDFITGWIVEPLVTGDYPKIMKKNVGSRLPSFTASQKKQLKGAFDFLGLNHYASTYATDNPSHPKPGLSDFNEDMRVKFAATRNETPIARFDPAFTRIHPPGLQRVLEYLKQAYGNPPIYIQENDSKIGRLEIPMDEPHYVGWPYILLDVMKLAQGRCIPDFMAKFCRYPTLRNITLNDSERIDAIEAYIGGVLGAIRNGSNIRGYFVWSFLDVFELLWGYQTPYGIYYVDFEDKERKRQPKLSAFWYRDFLMNKRQLMAI